VPVTPRYSAKLAVAKAQLLNPCPSSFDEEGVREGGEWGQPIYFDQADDHQVCHDGGKVGSRCHTPSAGAIEQRERLDECSCEAG
jgi:hypothetical protein